MLVTPARWLQAAAIAVTLAVSACMTTRPEPGRDAQGTRGVVTAGHPLAAEAGLAVLHGGGNAMDAAITAAAVLAVARPHMNGIGGDMFLLYYEASSGRVFALNASGRSGSLATMETAQGAADVNGAFPETGPTSVSVPGAVSGWAAALERFGTITFADALEPAAALAHAGLPVSERLAEDIAGQRTKLEGDAEAARIYLPGGEPPRIHGTLLQEDLAVTIDRLRANGPGELYDGDTGDRIAAHLLEHGGFVTRRDLARHQSEWVEPISSTYHDLTIYAPPPATQGVMLLEAFRLMESLDLASLGHNSADYLHTLAAVIRRAAADRDTSVADPETMRVTVAQLLDAGRLTALASEIDPAGSADAGAADAPDHPNTVYVSVVDSAGNVVSLIQSLFHSFGSGIVVPGTGIVLHNRGSLFRLDPGHPNAIGPRRRPYHTLCPALVLREGQPWLVLGTPGGDGQVHTLVQVLNNIRFFGMAPQEAIDAPRLRRLPSGALAIEDRVPEDVLDALVVRGYDVRPRSGWTAEFGGAQAVLVGRDGSPHRAGADRRREGWALAF